MKKRLELIALIGLIIFLIVFMIVSAIIKLNLWIYGGIIAVLTIAQIVFIARHEIRKKLIGRS